MENFEGHKINFNGHLSFSTKITKNGISNKKCRERHGLFRGNFRWKYRFFQFSLKYRYPGSSYLFLRGKISVFNLSFLVCSIFVSFIISLYSPTFSIFLLILAELIFLAIFDNAWVDLIFIFCSWGWENARKRPHLDEAYSLCISAWYKSPHLLFIAISPRAIGHLFIYIYSQWDIKKSSFAIYCHKEDFRGRKVWSLPRETLSEHGALVI